MNNALILLIGATVIFSGTIANSRTLSRLERVIERMEAATIVVASDLSTAQSAVDGVALDLAVAKTVVDGVALDLASAQKRADHVTEGLPGEAADAGAQSEK